MSKSLIKQNLIASCGMNCALCLGFQREKEKCYGCRNMDGFKESYKRKCVKRNCDVLVENGYKFCYECEKFPCTKLKQLDKRYRTRYGMSMIANLEFIRDNGIREFVKNEKNKWQCKKCQGTICIHRYKCLQCIKN
ncbi:MAG: DUF3795 domain-containing protein [bacterium]